MPPSTTEPPRRRAEAKDFAISDLRRQVADLLQHRQEAAALKRQMVLLDERVRARDSAQEAKLTELKAKLRLHATIEGQQEAQLGHALFLTGQVAWCWRCGAYSTNIRE